MKRTQTLSGTAKIIGSKERTYAYNKDPDDIPAWTGGVVNGHGVALKYSTGFDGTPPNFNAGRIPAGGDSLQELYLDRDVDARLKGLKI
jgi:hypothetical protein